MALFGNILYYLALFFDFCLARGFSGAIFIILHYVSLQKGSLITNITHSEITYQPQILCRFPSLKEYRALHCMTRIELPERNCGMHLGESVGSEI